MENYLSPTEVIGCDSPEIKMKAISLTSKERGDPERAKALFYFVRDQIKYRIAIFQDIEKERFRASFTLERGYGFCITKAILLIALNRAIGIPARLCLADIRDHHILTAIKELASTDIIAFHGYAEVFINERWIKVDPAFDIDLCHENQFIPVDFLGDKDALFHPFDLKGRSHIEYVRDRGNFADLPYDMLLSGLKEYYGPLDKEKLAKWNQGYY